jgi:hypothetical protein
MNIQDAMRELLYEPRREQAHVAREADEINFVFDEGGYDFAVVIFARLTLRWDDSRSKTSLSSGLNARSVSAIRNHDGNLGAGYPAGRNAVGNRHEVGAASREEYAEGFHQDNIIHHGSTDTRTKSKEDAGFES